MLMGELPNWADLGIKVAMPLFLNGGLARTTE